MANSRVQKGKCIFHLTHINNIPSILKNGVLSKNECLKRRMKMIDVSHENIQDVRAKIIIPETGYCLHDCVPMFFGARPPMLYAVRGKGFDQEDMVYVLVSWDIIGRKDVWFTDGNARTWGTQFYKKDPDLDKIDFEAAGAYYWHNKGDDYKRKKQAEVLKLTRIDLEEILGFAVYNKTAKERLQKTLESQGFERKIFVVSEFYY